MSEPPLGLAEAIRRVRAELLVAQSEGMGEDLRFRLGEVQLQFEVEFSREGGAETGVKLWVVTAAAKGSVTSSKTHTVTLTITPQQLAADGSAEDVMVSDQVVGRPALPTAQQHAGATGGSC